MLPSWEAPSKIMQRKIEKENLSLSNLNTISTDYELLFKTKAYATSRVVQTITRCLQTACNQDAWAGSNGKTLGFDEITTQLGSEDLTAHKELKELRDVIMTLLQRMQHYVELSSKTYAASITEMQLKAKQSVESTSQALNMQSGRTINDLHGTLEDMYNQKLKLEQSLQKHKAASERQAKEANDAKDAIVQEYEVKLKQTKQQHESALRALKDELAKDKTALKAADEAAKDKTADFNKRMKALTKKTEEMALHEERLESSLRFLKGTLEKLEAENARLKRDAKGSHELIAEAVHEERDRQHAAMDMERRQHAVALKALEAGHQERLEHAHAEMDKKRVSLEESTRRKVEKLRAAFREEKQELTDVLSRRHQEETENRKQLYEQEVRELLREVERLRRKLSARAATVDSELQSAAPVPHHPLRVAPHPVVQRSSSAASSPVDRPRAKSPHKSPMYGGSKDTMPARTQLSRQYVAKLDDYIQSNASPSTQHRAKSSPSKPTHTALSSRDTASFRYPAPVLYEEEYYGLDRTKHSSRYESPRRVYQAKASMSPEKNPNSPYRFPTPPEYRTFYQNNVIVEGEELVDQSENQLLERVSLLSYSGSDED